MKKYPVNSPEAMARLLVMQMISDGSFDPEEIERIEHLHVYELLGISRKEFIQVLQTYCNDLSDEADDNGDIHLIDANRIDDLLDTVQEARKRLIVAALALDISKADHVIKPGELLVLNRMLERWHLGLEDLQAAFCE